VSAQNTAPILSIAAATPRSAILTRLEEKENNVMEKKKLTADEQTLLSQFDSWLQDGGPAALVIRELLEPVEGPDGVFFPATYAPSEDKKTFLGGYNIDTFPDGTNICLVDSFGSQANRIEPVFAAGECAQLVPQLVIKAGDKEINILKIGHRAGDALPRCSDLQEELHNAFKDVLMGNAEPLAKIAPTSLVFGVWDSRDTQPKLPRLVSSTIRAFNIRKLTRGAVYTPPVNYSELDVFSEKEKEKAEGDKKSPLAKRGFVHNPASGTHGGVQLMIGEKIQGYIRRDATLGLAALRRLTVLDLNGTLSTDRTKALRRYILGLALVALTATQETYLRQGCNLVPADEGKCRSFQIVNATGKRVSVFETQEEADEFQSKNSDAPKPFVLEPKSIRQFAILAARQFGIDPDRDRTKNELPDRIVSFSKELAKTDIKGDAGNTEKLKAAEVISLDAKAQRFTVKIDLDGELKEVVIDTNEKTKFKKGRSNKTFDELVTIGAKLDVEVTNEVAVKVTGKN